MVEILLVLTLIAAISTAGLLAVFLLRAKTPSAKPAKSCRAAWPPSARPSAPRWARPPRCRTARSTACARRIDDNLARRRTAGSTWSKLDRLQQDNAAKLEQMRQTVDEKLHATLEKRLSESFRQVSERLELVHKGLGEMQTLAAGVGDLKRVLSNVKTRGVFGETQLAALLEQVMAPEQYEKNVATRPGSNARVEFAIKLPGRDGGAPVLLPIDAKFPIEDYQRLQAAQEAGDKAALEMAEKALEARVKLEAKAIAEKYVEPPHTTDFALLYLPFEGLFGEVLRRPGPVRPYPAPVPRHDLRADQPARLSEQPADGLPHARHPAALLRSVESARHGEVRVRQVRRGAGEHQAPAADGGQHHRPGRSAHAPDRAQAEGRRGRCRAPSRKTCSSRKTGRSAISFACRRRSPVGLVVGTATVKSSAARRKIC